MGDEWTRQLSFKDVIPELQDQEVPVVGRKVEENERNISVVVLEEGGERERGEGGSLKIFVPWYACQISKFWLSLNQFCLNLLPININFVQEIQFCSDFVLFPLNLHQLHPVLKTPQSLYRNSRKSNVKGRHIDYCDIRRPEESFIWQWCGQIQVMVTKSQILIVCNLNILQLVKSTINLH